jgi:hypothetical protein
MFPKFAPAEESFGGIGNIPRSLFLDILVEQAQT